MAALVLAAALAAASPQCAPVELALGNAPATFRGKPFRETSARFAKAYAQACGQSLIKGRALPRQLFLFNAPNANVASIYRTGKVTVLEYPFVSEDGKVHVPDAAELHEAIYCRVHGASPKEQEESGRCLPD
jgi:hypothetical protein